MGLPHDGDLEVLLQPVARTVELEAYLLQHSGLPGPRANLELAAAFARQVALVDDRRRLKVLLLDWAELSADTGPTGDRREFLPFCALQAFAATYAKEEPDERGRIEQLLRAAANDQRWRLREAAAMGLQRIGEADRGVLVSIIRRWSLAPTLLEDRAIVAALAHPPILDRAIAIVALHESRRILARVSELDQAVRRSEEFRVLSKGLEYAISVFVAALPAEGFEFLREMASSDDPGIRRILAANLGKARLARPFPDEVSDIARGLDSRGR